MLYYKHIIFDLDGTLTNSKQGIVNAAIYAFRKMGIDKPPVDELNRLIGIPLQEYLKIDGVLKDEQINEAVNHFRKYYAEKGAFENKPYRGVLELLKELKDKGVKMYISTAKYEKYAKVVVDHFNISPYIRDLVGADAAGLHATKTELTASLISRNNITDLKHTVMVGDKDIDMQAGKNTNIDTIGVTYGFGTKTELQIEKPDYIVNSIEELSYIILNKS